MHFSVLSPKQKKLLPQLGFLKKYGFYLAGGTGLALQLGHRTSLDFDFYNQSKFREEVLSKRISGFFPSLEQRFIGEGTLRIVVNKLEASFFYYPYPLIRPFIKEQVFIASAQDIAAMKLLAVASRGTRRDFIDLYFLIQEFGLAQLFQFLTEKYKQYDPYHALVGLTYFEDADKEKETKRFTLLRPVPSWPKMKNHFKKLAFEFKKEFFK